MKSSIREGNIFLGMAQLNMNPMIRLWSIGKNKSPSGKIIFFTAFVFRGDRWRSFLVNLFNL